jgi:hypothetical protein
MDDKLRFPSGITLGQLKRDAAKLSKREGLAHTEALNRLAQQHAGAPYDDALRRARSAAPSLSRPEARLDLETAPRCAVCGEGALFSRLLAVGHAFEPAEFVHHRCVLDSEDAFGFCDVCGETLVHRSEGLHAHGEYVECDEHEGEFSSNTPEEDADRQSLAEYFLEHPPE